MGSTVDGDGLGTVVGAALGDVDGVAVGLEVGSDGVEVGSGVVGPGVGIEVGSAAVGGADGVDEAGAAVGAATGAESVGREAGTPVGREVGGPVVNIWCSWKIWSAGKLALFGSTPASCGSSTPNHWPTAFHTASHGVVGMNLPRPTASLAWSESRSGKRPRIWPPRMLPPNAA